MNSIKIDKKKLLAKIKENLAKHIAEFKETQKNYIIELRKVLDEKIVAIDNQQECNQNIKLVAPVSYEKDYKTAISMLEYSVDKTVELQQHEFQQYVLDEWQWKNTFAATNNFYNSK